MHVLVLLNIHANRMIQYLQFINDIPEIDKYSNVFISFCFFLFPNTIFFHIQVLIHSNYWTLDCLKIIYNKLVECIILESMYLIVLEIIFILINNFFKIRNQTSYDEYLQQL